MTTPLRSSLLGVLIASTFLGGCAVGPNYRRPSVETPATYRVESDAAAEIPDAKALADLPWWELFDDHALQGLIEEALANNYDLRIAAKRVEQARYAVGTTRADLLPQVGYQGSATRAKVDNAAGDNPTVNQFFGAFQMAWEIDVWGRIRRATEASFADMVAAEDVRRGVILSLVTSVAQAYFDLCELDLELEIAQRTRDSFDDTLKLFTRQLQGGVGTKLATSRAEAALASATSTIPEIERQIVAKENQLSLLLGRAPGAISRGHTLTEQRLPPNVPAGLPAALLERRPDILRAEQNMIASNALVGVALTNFLPRIGLTTLYGGQSSEIEDIVKGPANVWSVAGSVLGPLFQGGRLYYSYKGSVASWEEAQLAYEQSVLSALAEVSNALVARQKYVAVRVEQERQVDALKSAVRLSTLRYTGGLAGYYEVIEAQQQLFPAELALARTRLNQWSAIVTLYRALGGGWRLEEEKHPERYPSRREPLDRIVPQAVTSRR